MKSPYHFVARANPLLQPLTQRKYCADLWRRLTVTFPDTLACVLMPNHLHIIVPTSDPTKTKFELSVQLRAWTQRFYSNCKIWSPLPAGNLIPDAHHLKRQIRYIHLNPCRAQLASDPLSWEWSTHRDICGRIVNSWPKLPELSRIFQTPTAKLANTVHQYCSSDPTVSIQGTALDSPHQLPVLADIALIHQVAASVLREQLTFQRGTQRSLTLQIAKALHVNPDPDYLKVRPKTCKQIGTPSATAVAIALRNLRDPRCTQGFLRSRQKLTTSKQPNEQF
jgi:hypothetical protein